MRGLKRVGLLPSAEQYRVVYLWNISQSGCTRGARKRPMKVHVLICGLDEAGSLG